MTPRVRHRLSEGQTDGGMGLSRILRDGKIVGQVPAAPASRFGRPLFQTMSYHDTSETPLPEMRFVDVSGSAANQYTLRTVNSVGLPSD